MHTDLITIVCWPNFQCCTDGSYLWSWSPDYSEKIVDFI